ncbi:hypothetical protein [Pedobacter nyackensis]|uniref:Uncharacterized protein n=1 Tax=Pedobacter nyackensis TaxID=475255 RepID=A0A1W2EFU5_9SPHI|nr:hypothetical protein [Pedobacter nyackensis]SMD08589.1 hypothetical protein SAMN04488101_11243 [Pedobacter nyackensis]
MKKFKNSALVRKKLITQAFNQLLSDDKSVLTEQASQETSGGGTK